MGHQQGALKYDFRRAVDLVVLACFSAHADICVHIEIILAVAEPSVVLLCAAGIHDNPV